MREPSQPEHQRNEPESIFNKNATKACASIQKGGIIAFFADHDVANKTTKQIKFFKN